MKILQRSNYIVYFDNVRVDPFVVSWNTKNGLFANDASANITLFRSDAMDNWKAYLTQVKIFGENPFTKKFTLMFDGEIMNRSWNQNRSDMGKVTFQAKGYYHWLDIQVPLAIQSMDEYDPLLRFIYEAQNINIDEVRTLITPNSEVLMKDKNIEEIIDQLFSKLTMGYYDVAGDETAFAFAKVKDRFKVMVDVLPEFREAGFLDLFTFTKTTQIESFYVFLNEVLAQLMFEFYQDRDGSFRIKTPSWADNVMKAHVIDSSIVTSISGLDDWEQEPTRVLAIGAETQYYASMRQQGIVTDDALNHLSIPVGLYIGDPQDPDNEEYYSQTLEHYAQQYGVNPLDYGTGGISEGVFSSGEWFDNTGGYSVTSGHRSVNPGRASHAGVDFNLKYEPVYSIGTHGVVTKQGLHSTMGNYVAIEQTIGGKKYIFRYMHFNEPAFVKVGSRVSPGQQIGISGNTGRSTGAHLHLEIWPGATDNGNDINPIPFLQAQKAAQENALANIGIGVNAGAKAGIQTAINAVKNNSNSATATGWETFAFSSYNALCPPVTINGRKFKGCTGITATGWDVKDGSMDHRVIAVDKSVIPLYSIVEIEGMGLYNAADTGGDITGKRIDLLATSYEEAMKFGRQNLRVRIVRSGKGDGSRVPAVKKGQTPTWNGKTGNVAAPTASFSSPYANVDSPKLNPVGFKQIKYSGFDVGGYSNTSTVGTKKEEIATPKPVTYSAKDKVGIIPTYSKEFETAIVNNTGGISPALITAIIEHSSGWREKSSTTTHTGLMGIPNNYVNDVLPGQNMLNGNNSVNFGSDFLKAAMDRFNGKVSFALAAYYLGSLSEVESATKKVGVLDFSKTRGEFDADTLAFVDKVISTYTSAGGNYIKGDPHIDFGTKSSGPGGYVDEDGNRIAIDNVSSENNEVPDYESSYRAKLSKEETKYKVNLKRVEQALIRADSPAIKDNSMKAEKLIYQFAKYTMQLHRARTHNVNVSLSACLPFIRPGYNAWIEPTRTDIVCYVTGVSHQGSFQDGCTTNINGGFVRSPKNYRDIDSSIFVGETRATSDSFGEVLMDNEMQGVRDELNAMHDKELVGEAHEFSVLNGLYSSMNKNNEFTTQWNEELTAEEVDKRINQLFSGAPSVVKERMAETALAIEKSKEIFVEKLLYMKHN